MKRSFLILLTLLCIALASNKATAQVKIGYIDLDTLMAQMPETKDVKKQMDAFTKPFIDHLTKMNDDYTSYGLTYVHRKMTDSIVAVESKKLQMILKEMQDFQDNAFKMVAAKKDELLKPISDKAIAALSQVAKENGISYVIDSSKNTRLIVAFVASDEINLMDAVKAKLGIK
ncbi:OmpH family outer membrane protein [Mucilaginibacter ginsenosidivorax]|uniref:OmpH family outer membrane protein n=1 Tax=Mucilaginibacter ginsenosidivorax TaxID=862126 RepID=A0A5B8W4A3_9SPHI|nr:OmpH family outer membrane protein [Mucilaginibacter ginsenosidivorax]QEC78664.1 OmpH family outer membrane protein [Mucilaginibacter ginsenosidivorax]